jgi:hypothetical protein
LIQPFPTNELSTAEHQVRQLWDADDFAAENVVNMRPGDTEDLGDFLDGQNG